MANKLTHPAASSSTNTSVSQYQKIAAKRKAWEEEQERNRKAQEANSSWWGKVKHNVTGGLSDQKTTNTTYPEQELWTQDSSVQPMDKVHDRSSSIDDYDTERIYEHIASFDDEQDREALLEDYVGNYAMKAGSKLYNPYVYGISNDEESVGMFARASFDEDWITQNAQKYAPLLNLADGSKPSKPTKSSSQEYREAYQWYSILKNEDTTQRAESEDAKLRKQIYDMRSVNPDATAEEILSGIDWEGNYPTLALMREAQSGYSRVTLNRGVGCSDEYVKALTELDRRGYQIYDAENPSASQDWFMTLAEDTIAAEKLVNKHIDAVPEAKTEEKTLDVAQEHVATEPVASETVEEAAEPEPVADMPIFMDMDESGFAADLAKPFGQRSFDLLSMETEPEEEDPVKAAIPDYDVTMEEFKADEAGQKSVYDAVSRSLTRYGDNLTYYGRSDVTDFDMRNSLSDDDRLAIYNMVRARDTAREQMVSELPLGRSVEEVEQTVEQYDRAIADYCDQVVLGAKDATAEKRSAQFSQWASEHPVIAGASSIALSAGQQLAASAMVVPAVADAIKTGELDTNSPMFALSDMVQSVRDGSVSKLNNVGKFLVNTLYSAADSVARVALAQGLGGAEVGGLVLDALSGAGASVPEMKDVYEETGNTALSVLAGATSGVFEALFEKVGADKALEKAFKTGGAALLTTGWKETWRKLGASILSEGAEEGLTDIANGVANIYLSRALDDSYGYTAMYDAIYNNAVDSGAARDEARKAAYDSVNSVFARDLALDMLAGGISGGLIESGNSISGSIRTSRIKREALGAAVSDSIAANRALLDVGDGVRAAAKNVEDAVLAESAAEHRLASESASLERVRQGVSDGSISFEDAAKTIDDAVIREEAAQKDLESAKRRSRNAEREFSYAKNEQRKANKNAIKTASAAAKENVYAQWGNVLSDVRGALEMDGDAAKVIEKYQGTPYSAFVGRYLYAKVAMGAPVSEADAVSEEGVIEDRYATKAPATVKETPTYEPIPSVDMSEPVSENPVAEPGQTVEDALSWSKPSSPIISGTTLERANNAAMDVVRLEQEWETLDNMCQEKFDIVAKIDAAIASLSDTEAELMDRLTEKRDALMNDIRAYSERVAEIARKVEEAEAEYRKLSATAAAEELVAEETPVEEAGQNGIARASELLSKRFDVETVNPQEIQTDPETFQFKRTDSAEGTNAEDRLDGEWKNGLAGQMIVYQKADGTQYIADGHHRLELAKKNGVTEINATVLRETDGYTERDARLYATMRNIAEEHGSVHDMARFFRESGITTEDAQSLGITMTKAKAGEAARIANVSDATWEAYEEGRLADHAVALAGTMPDETHERLFVKVMLNAKSQMTNAAMDEVAVNVALAKEATNNVQMTLGDFLDLSNYSFEQIGRIAAAVKRKLSEDTTALKRAMGRTGVKIANVDGNSINKENTAAQKDFAQRAQDIFSRYATNPELSALVGEHAAMLRDGKQTLAKSVDSVYNAVIEEAAKSYVDKKGASVLDDGDRGNAQDVGEADTDGAGRDGIVLEQPAGEGRDGQRNGGDDTVLAYNGSGTGTTGAAVEETDRVSSSLKKLSKALGLMYSVHNIGNNVTRQYNGSGVLGYYDAKTGVSSIPYLSKTRVWAHETGHAIMGALGLNNDTNFMDALQGVWDNAIPDSFKAGYAGKSDTTHRMEAFAEILRTYIEGGEHAARAMAGKDVMDTFLSKLGKKQKRALDRCAEEVISYNNATVMAKAKSYIVDGHRSDFSGALDKLNSAVFDKYYAVKRMEEKAARNGAALDRYSDRASTLYDNLASSVGRARHILTGYMPSPDGTRRIEDSLSSVLSPIAKNERKDFSLYIALKADGDRKVVNDRKAQPLQDAVLRRTDTYIKATKAEEEGRNAGMSKEVIRRLTDAAAKAKEAMDKAVAEYNDMMSRDFSIFPQFDLAQEQDMIRSLDEKYGHFAGVQERICQWIDTFNRAYIVDQNLVPNARERYAAMHEMYPNYVPGFRAMDDEIDAFSQMDARESAKSAGVWARLKGNSDRALIDPIVGLQSKVMGVVIRQERALADRRLARIADSVPNMGSFLRKLDASEIDAENIDGRKDIFRVVRSDGSEGVYQITDPLLEQELNYMPREFNGFAWKVLSDVSNAMKGGMTTYNPAFMLTNMPRDFLQGYATTTTAPNIIKYTADWVKGQGVSLKSYIEQLFGRDVSDSFYAEYMAAGGAEMQNIYKCGNISMVRSKISDILTLLSDATEGGTRFAEYKRARIAGENVSGAYRMAANLTTDFGRRGTSDALRLVGKGFLFMNAGLQGIYDGTRMYNEGKINRGQYFSRMARVAGIYAALPVIARMAVKAAGDDEEYEKLSDSVKRSYYIFPNPLFGVASSAALGTNRFIKIPRPQSYFATIGDLMGRVWMDNDDASEVIADGISDANPWGSPVWASLYELVTNRSWTGKAIESEYWRQSGKSRRYWVNDDTSSIAVWLGGIADDLGIDISPIQIDYYLDQTGGFPGDIITSIRSGNVLRDSFDTLMYKLSTRLLTDPTVASDIVSSYYAVAAKIATVAADTKNGGVSVEYPNATSDAVKDAQKRIRATKERISELYDEADASDDAFERQRVKARILDLCLEQTRVIEKVLGAWAD